MRRTTLTQSKKTNFKELQKYQTVEGYHDQHLIERTPRSLPLTIVGFNLDITVLDDFV
jgi:hypothetical protein